MRRERSTWLWKINRSILSNYMTYFLNFLEDPWVFLNDFYIFICILTIYFLLIWGSNKPGNCCRSKVSDNVLHYDTHKLPFLSDGGNVWYEHTCLWVIFKSSKTLLSRLIGLAKDKFRKIWTLEFYSIMKLVVVVIFNCLNNFSSFFKIEYLCVAFIVLELAL